MNKEFDYWSQSIEITWNVLSAKNFMNILMLDLVSYPRNF